MSKVKPEPSIGNHTKIGDYSVYFWFVDESCEKSEFLQMRRKMYGPDDKCMFCAITGERLKPEDGIYGVIGCLELFPNCVVSKKLADELGANEVAKRLLQSWTEAQRYRQWWR